MDDPRSGAMRGLAFHRRHAGRCRWHGGTSFVSRLHRNAKCLRASRDGSRLRGHSAGSYDLSSDDLRDDTGLCRYRPTDNCKSGKPRLQRQPIYEALAVQDGIHLPTAEARQQHGQRRVWFECCARRPSRCRPIVRFRRACSACARANSELG